MTSHYQKDPCYPTFRCVGDGNADLPYYLGHLGTFLWTQRRALGELRTHLAKDFPDTTLDDCVALWIRKYVRGDDHTSMQAEGDATGFPNQRGAVLDPSRIADKQVKRPASAWEQQRTVDMLRLYDNHRDSVLEIILTEQMLHLTPTGTSATFVGYKKKAPGVQRYFRQSGGAR